MKKTSESPKRLGEYMRSVREGLRLSIPDLAEKLKIDRNTLGGYEREERRLPDMEFLVDFGVATKAPLSELINARFASSPYSEKFFEATKAHTLEQTVSTYRAVDTRMLAAATSAVEQRMPQVTADAKAQVVVACYELLVAKGSADTTALKEFLDAIAGLAVETGREHVGQERRRIRRRKTDAKDRAARLSDGTQDEG